LLDYDSYAAARMATLRKSAYLLCGDWDRGDDLVQRTMEDLYVGWSTASRADNIDAYVRTMLVHRFLDERRSGWARRVRLTGTDLDLEPRPSSDPDPADRLDVRAALATLPPRQRAVVVLRFLEDLSVEQTAEALGCGTGTVKSQTARALATLRPLLQTGGRIEPAGEQAAQLASTPTTGAPAETVGRNRGADRV
jgi:RNA polymerase sigma-70 factor (sigma-E family)